MASPSDSGTGAAPEDASSTSAYDDMPSQAWVLPVQEVPSKHYQHFCNVLRYAQMSGLVDKETLASLLDMVDNFVLPETDRSELAAAMYGRASYASTSEDDEDDDADADGDGDGGSSDGSSEVSAGEDPDNDLGGGHVPSRSERLKVVARTMEHPLQGVKVGRHRYRFSTYYDVFTGADAVSWIVERGYETNRRDALRLGRQLLDHGHIVHVSGKRSLEDRPQQFYRFSKHPAPLSLHMPAVSSSCPSMGAALLRLVYAVHDGDVPRWLNTARAEHLRVAFPAVLLWSRQNKEEAGRVTKKIREMCDEDQSLAIMVMGFHRANNSECMAAQGEIEPTPAMKATVELVSSPPPGSSAKQFEREERTVQHPFTNEETTVKFEREFNSSVKPTWVSFRNKSGERVLPDAVAKCGDDLRKDLAVQLLFRVCESFWAAAPVVWRCETAPTVGTLGVVVTSEKAGYLEFVKGKTVKEVAAANEWKDVDLHKFAPSVVGSLMSGFVLGVRDRHSENFMLLGDPKKDPRLIQIDFGYMLMEAPGGLALDTPRLTLQPQLIKLLRAAPGHDENHTLLEDIQHDLITAYRVMRNHYAAFVSFARVVLSNIYPQSKITGHLWGVHAFRAGQSESKALRWIEDKITTQLNETNLRRGAKHAIVRAYYGFRNMTG